MLDGKPYYKSKYFWAGVFFLIVQIIVVIRNYFSNYLYFFWFCDFAPLLLAIAFFLEKEHLAKAVINFGLIFQISFIIHYIHSIIAGTLGEELIFSPFFNFIYLFATILFHLSTTFALFLTYKIKPSMKTVNYSILVVVVIYLISLVFTPISSNINLVHVPWNIIPFIIPYYIYLWPTLAILFLVLPIQSFQYFLYKLANKKN